MNKRITALLLLLVAISAAHAASIVNTRANHWRQRLAHELPAGTPYDAISKWVSKNHLSASHNAETHEIVLSLESVPEPKTAFSASPSVCKGWSISAVLQLDAADHLASAQVRTLGNCL